MAFSTLDGFSLSEAGMVMMTVVVAIFFSTLDGFSLSEAFTERD